MKLLNIKILILIVALIGVFGAVTALGYDPNDPNTFVFGVNEPNNWEVGAPFNDFSNSGDGNDSMVMLTGTSMPSSFDWRNVDGVDYTTPIRNQLGCGSCWAFSAIAPLESQIKWCHGTDSEQDLSEQWLVSCTAAGSCSGGWPSLACNYMKRQSGGYYDSCGDTGAILEEDFTYTATNATCGCPYDHYYWIEDWSYIGTSSGATVPQIKEAIYTYGPVSVCIRANNSNFLSYSGGIYTYNDTRNIDHAVALVGWDDNQGTDGVWFLRNSWGTNWGESGYMRIEYGKSRVGYAGLYVDYRCGIWPEIESVAALSATQVKVRFTEDVDETTAETTGNYSIDQSVTVSSAVRDNTYHNIVTLTTSTLSRWTPGNQVTYNLTVEGVEDLDGRIVHDDMDFAYVTPSLYVMANINARPSPLNAYEIAGNTLTYEDVYNVEPHGWGAVNVAIDSNDQGRVNGYVFVTYEQSDTIQLVNGETMQSEGTVIAPSASDLAGVLVDQKRDKVYAVDRATNHLYVYSWNRTNATLTNDVTTSPYYKTLTGCMNEGNKKKGAYGIALDETNDRLYVADLTTE
ncbi:MAG: C1 family peptidase, partial [Planctomycetota bacterium]